MKNNDFEKMRSIFERAAIEVKQELYGDGSGYLSFVLPKKIITERGYKQDVINFSFNPTGKVDGISLSINDYDIQPSGKFGDITNQVDF